MAVSDPCASAPGGERVEATRLSELALFSSIDESTLKMLAERLRVVRFASGDHIFEEGDSGRAMYVVLEGCVTMTKRSRSGDAAAIVSAEVGDWFGEMSLLDVMARPVTAQAEGPCSLLTMCPTDLNAVYRTNLKMYALLVMNMARQLSRKLRGVELSLACALCDEIHTDADDAS